MSFVIERTKPVSGLDRGSTPVRRWLVDIERRGDGIAPVFAMPDGRHRARTFDSAEGAQKVLDALRDQGNSIDHLSVVDTASITDPVLLSALGRKA